jgi:hypothetical protein
MLATRNECSVDFDGTGPSLKSQVGDKICNVHGNVCFDLVAVDGESHQDIVDGQKMMNSRTMTMKTGTRTGMLYLNTYPMKEGILTPDCSAIALTMKFGPLPM